MTSRRKRMERLVYELDGIVTGHIQRIPRKRLEILFRKNTYELIQLKYGSTDKSLSVLQAEQRLSPLCRYKPKQEALAYLVCLARKARP